MTRNINVSWWNNNTPEIPKNRGQPSEFGTQIVDQGVLIYSLQFILNMH